MNRCECGHPVFGRNPSSDCNRAFCPLQRRVLFNGTRCVRGLAAAAAGIALMVFGFWAVWKIAQNVIG